MAQENLLTASEVQELLTLEKHYEGEERFEYPCLGGTLAIKLSSRSPKKEEFILDIERGRAKISKNKFQNRARSTIVLVRLDIDGAPHRNPDGEDLPGTHLHTYAPGMGDKWATTLPIPDELVSNTEWILNWFMDHCRIITKPIIQGGLFL